MLPQRSQPHSKRPLCNRSQRETPFQPQSERSPNRSQRERETSFQPQSKRDPFAILDGLRNVQSLSPSFGCRSHLSHEPKVSRIYCNKTNKTPFKSIAKGLLRKTQHLKKVYYHRDCSGAKVPFVVRSGFFSTLSRPDRARIVEDELFRFCVLVQCITFTENCTKPESISSAVLVMSTVPFCKHASKTQKFVSDISDTGTGRLCRPRSI